MVYRVRQLTERSRTTKSRRTNRRLAAILGADIRGYSILMGDNEEVTHRRVRAAMDRLSREIEKSFGHVFSFAGDGLMAEFPSSVEAIKCALRVQMDASKRNARQLSGNRIEYRVGIHSGEMVLHEGYVGGNAVNIAARLEQAGEPGGIFISNAVFEQVSQVVRANYELVGERRFKNIKQSIVVYRISPEACQAWESMPTLPRETASTPTDNDYRPSLAVLPLRTIQRDMTDAYFAEGMVDDIIRLLSGLRELFVVSRSSTLVFAHPPLDLRRIGHELDVRYVLHGSVRRSADRLRIAVELGEAETAEAIWAAQFEGDLSDLFELQDRIAMQVAIAIAPQVRDRELERARRKHPSSMTAYDLTLQALDQIYRMKRESFERASVLLRQAIAHDPSYALAHTYSAYLRILLIGQGWSKDVDIDSGLLIAAAETAIGYDQNDAMALAIYGHGLSFARKDYDRAQTFLDRATIVGPSCAWAWSLSSFTRQYRGEAVGAVVQAERAVRLSPIGPDAFFHEMALAQAHYISGNYEQAIAWGRMSYAHSPDNGSNLRVLIASHVAVGDKERSAQFVQQLLSVAPEFRLGPFRARTPLAGEVRETFAERLRMAGLPD